MRYLKNYRRKIAFGDILTKKCMRLLNLSVNNDGDIINNGLTMKRYDLKTISLLNPIPYNDDRIDSVLFFGDGAIEFHLEKSCRGVNWADFSNDYIMLIIEKLKENQCLKFA